jgi:hypothetical protein
MLKAPEERLYRADLALRETQLVGRPYRYLEGRAVPYDTWADIGWFMEAHAARSFERSTKGGAGHKLPLLLFHDNRSMPIGHAEEWRHDDGLRGVWRLNDTADAQQAAALADNGDLVGLSIGFAPIDSKWDFVDDWAPELGADHKDRVTRVESRLLEVSLTPTPAFVDAEVTLVRTALAAHTRDAAAPPRPERQVDHWRREVERLRSG